MLAAIEPDYHHALSFLEALTGEDDPEVLFACIYDPPTQGAKEAPRHYLGKLSQLWPVLRGENVARNGVFFTVGKTKGATRKASDIVALRAAFIDQDRGFFPDPVDCHLPPSIMVNTGKGRHVYWLLKEGQPLEEFSALQRRLIARYQSDIQVNDLPRVMRVPGFVHHKGDPKPVRWYDVDPEGKAFYSLGEVALGLPADPKPSKSGPIGYALPEAGTRRVTAPDFAKLQKAGKVPLWAAEMVDSVVGGGVPLLDPVRNAGQVDNLVTKFLTWACGRFADATTESLMELFVGPWTLLSALDSQAGRPSYSVEDLVSKLSRAQAYIRESHQAEVEEHPWLDMVSRDENGFVIASRANLELVMRFHPKWRGVLAFDERFRRIVYRASAPWIGHSWAPTASGGTGGPPGAEGQNVSEHHAGLVASWFAAAEHLHLTRLTSSVIHEAVEAVAQENPFDPFQEWLVAQEWDGKARLTDWLHTYLGAELSEWTRAVGPRWLIAAVARTIEPGCKADEMLVLEGAQGCRKSSALRALAGADYFTDSLPRGGDATDMATALVGPVLVEIPEIDGVNRKKEASEVKAFLSKQVDRYRPKYGRREVDVPRRCVFAGSTNEREYLVDHTGGRRFWPVPVGVTRPTMDVDGLVRDRAQLWAEARAYYEMGVPWYLNASESKVAAGMVQGRQEVDPWQSVIASWIDRGGADTAQAALGVALGQSGPLEALLEVSMDDVLGKALQIPEGKRGAGDARRVGVCLRHLGYDRVKSHGRMVWRKG